MSIYLCSDPEVFKWIISQARLSYKSKITVRLTKRSLFSVFNTQLYYSYIMLIYSWAEFYCLCVWDAHFHIRMPRLIVNMGKISLFAWDAYYHSGMPTFTVKTGIRMPIFT